MRFYDYVRVEPDEKMLEIAKELGVELLHGLNQVRVVGDLAEAKRWVGRVKALFTPKVDEALISLAEQKKTFLGFFVADVQPRNPYPYIKWVRLVSRSRVPILLATGARTYLELRSGRDIARIGMLLGLRREDAFSSVTKRWRVVLETP